MAGKELVEQEERVGESGGLGEEDSWSWTMNSSRISPTFLRRGGILIGQGWVMVMGVMGKG